MSSERTIRFPCFLEELHKWQVPVNQATNSANTPSKTDYDTARLLLVCAFTSLKRLCNEPSYYKSDADSSSDEKLIWKYSHRIFRRLNSGLQTIKDFTFAYWSSPSPSLLAYAHLGNVLRQQPQVDCQLGYLSTASPWTNIVCLLTAASLKLVSLHSSCIHSLDLTRMEVDSFDGLESDLQKDLGSGHTLAKTDPDFYEWSLTYQDPWPSWRCLAFSPPRDCYSTLQAGSLRYRIIAVGYSNGSVDIIALKTLHSEKSEDYSSRIFLSAPYSSATEVAHLSFFPIVHCSFIDNEYLLVCHFRGHVDIWHLDWGAETYPSRLVARLYPLARGARRPTASSVPFIASADFHQDSGTLVLAGVPTRSEHYNPDTSKSMSNMLNLCAFTVCKNPPYLTRLGVPSVSSSMLDLGQIPSRLSVYLTSLRKWTSDRLRYSLSGARQSSELDMITRLSFCQSADAGLVFGALHSSESCSIWSIERMEPVSIHLAPGNSLSADASSPPVPLPLLQLTWWRVPVTLGDNEDSLAYDPHLVVLREDGCLRILSLSVPELGWLSLPEVLERQAGLSSYPRLAYLNHDVGCTSGSYQTSLPVLDVDPATPETLSRLTTLRALRLVSATPKSVYHHYIQSGQYDRAVQMTEIHSHLDIDLVYMQKWLDLSCDWSQLPEFQHLILVTLALVKHHVSWVLTQCLLFLPTSMVDSSNVTVQHLLNAIRHLLNHGLSIVNNSLSTVSYREALKTNLDNVKDKLTQRLFHVDCVEEILQQQQIYGGTDCIPALQALQYLRHNGPLTVAVHYAHTGNFQATEVLLNRLPSAVGQYRLAICDSLPEIVDPLLYARHLLSPVFSTRVSEPVFAGSPDNDSVTVNELIGDPAGAAEKLCCQSSPAVYTRQLADWLVKRALAIDHQSGLVNHAVNLLRVGGELSVGLVKLVAGLERAGEDTRQMYQALQQLHSVHCQFEQFATLIYYRPVSLKTTTTSVVLNATSSWSRSFPQATTSSLGRFKAADYLELSVEDRLEMLLQMWLTGSPPRDAQLTDFLRLHLFSPIGLMTNSNDSRLVTQCLLSAANRSASLVGHIHLVGQLRQGPATAAVGGPETSFSWSSWLSASSGRSMPNRHREEVDDAGTQWWWHSIQESAEQEAIRSELPEKSLSDIAPHLLCCLCGAVRVYEPGTFALEDSKFSASPQGRSARQRSALSAYADEVSRLTNSMRQCVSSSNGCSSQLIDEIQRLTRCSTTLRQLIDLADQLEEAYQPADGRRCLLSIGVTSLGQLEECTWSEVRLQALVNHWVALLVHRLLPQGRKSPSKPAEVKGQRARLGGGGGGGTGDAGLDPMERLSDLLDQLYTILASPLVGEPMQTHLLPCLQLAILLAGNGDERLLDLSLRQTTGRVNSKAVYSTSQLHWEACLLRAIRNYVDMSSLPRCWDWSTSEREEALPITLDPDDNEYLAHRFIRSARSRDLATRAQHRMALDREESLLWASAFLTTVAGHRPSSAFDTCLLLTLKEVSPLYLRAAWTDTSINMWRRQVLLRRALTHTFLIHFDPHLAKIDPRLAAVIRVQSVQYQLAKWFLLSVADVERCFAQAVLVVTLMDQQGSALAADVFEELQLLFLKALASGRRHLWFETAVWAGYWSTERLKCEGHSWPLVTGEEADRLLDALQATRWTRLGRLFSRDLEAIRLRLVLFSLAHCQPASSSTFHPMVGLSALLADTWFRLHSDEEGQHLVNDIADEEDAGRGTVSTAATRFVSLIGRKVFGSAAASPDRTVLEKWRKRLPRVYNAVPVGSTQLLTGCRVLSHSSETKPLELGQAEHQLWVHFLRRWRQEATENVDDEKAVLAVMRWQLTWFQAAIDTGSRGDLPVCHAYSRLAMALLPATSQLTLTPTTCDWCATVAYRATVSVLLAAYEDDERQVPETIDPLLRLFCPVGEGEAPGRLRRWIDSLVYEQSDTFWSRLRIDRRAWLLGQSLGFVSRQLKKQNNNPPHSDWLKLHDDLAHWTNHFNRLVSSLADIPFPGKSTESSYNHQRCPRSRFLAELLVRKPGDVSLPSLMLSLVDDVIGTSDEREEEGFDPSVWLSTYLFHCLAAVDLPREVCIDTIVYAVVGLSTRFVRLSVDLFQPADDEDPLGRLFASKLWPVFDAAAGSPAEPEDTRVSRMDLLVASLCQRALRRQYGGLLTQRLRASCCCECLPSAQFSACLRRMLLVQGLPQELTTQLLDNASEDSVAGCLASVGRFLVAVTEHWQMQETDDHRGVEDLGPLVLVCRDVVELCELVFGADAESSMVQLWSDWLNLGLRLHVFQTDQSTVHLLKPTPAALVSAGLHHPDWSSWPDGLQLVFLEGGLRQPTHQNRPLVEEVIQRLCPVVISTLETLDRSACCQFAQHHPDLWIAMATEQDVALVALFNQILRSVRYGLVRMGNAERAHQLCRRLWLVQMRDAQLWLEAASLLQAADSDSVDRSGVSWYALKHLVHLVATCGQDS